MSKKLLPLTEAAIFAALAMALSLLPDFAAWFTPSLGTIPLLLLALRRGSKLGFLTGLGWGLLHFLLSKVYYLSLSQVFIEYVLAFSILGLAGFFSTPLKNALLQGQKNKALVVATSAAFLAILARYFLHFIAGIIYWASYAPEGMSPIFYSFTVNGTAGLLTLICSLVVLLPILYLQARFFLVD